MAARAQIQDAQAEMAQSDRTRDPGSRIVRTAIANRLHHAPQDRFLGWPTIVIPIADDPTHELVSLFKPGTKRSPEGRSTKFTRREMTFADRDCGGSDWI